jgi:putative flippase GtrA
VPASKKTARRARARQLIGAVRDSELAVDEAVLRLSRSRRWLAPLAFTVGAAAMLFEGLRLLLTNWRLALIQVLPAVWIWAAMLDLKAHAFRGRTFHVPDGAVVIAVVAAIAAVTAASFFLNAVFAFAVAGPRPPLIRPAFARARSHLAVILGSGLAVGVLLGLAAVVFPRWGPLWFAISLSIVIGVMMICYVAVPARLIGVKTAQPRRDKLAATAVGCAIGAVVSAPPYLLGRAGLLLLGSGRLFALGVIVFTVGLMLEAAATTAVKTIKMSAKLISGQRTARGQAADGA